MVMGSIPKVWSVSIYGTVENCIAEGRGSQAGMPDPRPDAFWMRPRLKAPKLFCVIT